MNTNFEKLCMRSGGYALPWLIHLRDEGSIVNYCYVNNTQSILYNGKTYVASSFSYTPNSSENGFNGGGSLEIVVTDNSIINLIETYRNIRLDVVGVLVEDGTISEIKTFRHHYGSVSWDGKKATFNFEKDDRLDMTFPALIFNNDNNRGNA